jgi:hypothetical protein
LFFFENEGSLVDLEGVFGLAVWLAILVDFTEEACISKEASKIQFMFLEGQVG